MGNKEYQRQDAEENFIKDDADKAWGLLTDQYENLSGGENPVLKESEFKAQQAAAQYEQQVESLSNRMGATGLAGSGTAAKARQALAQNFQNSQSFQREQALDTQQSELDRIRVEMQNLISTTNTALSGLTKLDKSKRRYDPPGDESVYLNDED